MSVDISPGPETEHQHHHHLSSSDRDFQPHTRLLLMNKGVGPAKVESLEVFYDRVAQPGPRALVSSDGREGVPCA